MALGPPARRRPTCARSRRSRALENRPDARTLLRMGRGMVDLYCASFRQVPRRIVLDIDDTFDAVHGGQQLRLFNAHYDEYGFQPIVVFDGEGRIVAAVLRPARRPSGREIVGLPAPPDPALPWPLAARRDPAPRRQPLLPRPRCCDFCRAERRGLHPRRRHQPDAAQPCRRPGGQHDGARRQRRQRARSGGSRSSMTAPQAGAGSSASSPASRPDRRAATPASSSPASTAGRGKRALPGSLLPPRPGREPHQGVEDAISRPTAPSCSPGHRQPDAPDRCTPAPTG